MKNLLENGSFHFALILMMILPAMLLIPGSASAVLVTGPTMITEPGTYQIGQDISAGDAGVCIQVLCSDVTIEGNGHTLEGSGGDYSCGVLVHGSGPLTNVHVQDLHLSDWFYGVYYWDAAGTIQENTLTGNTYGVVLNPGGGSTVSGNTVTAGQYGMVFATSSSPVEVTGNTLAQNAIVGLYLYETSCLTIANNYLDCDQNVLTGGSVSEVTWNIPRREGISISGGEVLGGNFWAAPNGKGFSQTMTDSDGDGICDRSYPIGNGMFDEFPLHAPGGESSLVHAGFSVSGTSGAAPFSVRFLDTSTGLPTQWFWLFGDGESATVQNPVHLYTEPGVYTVTLRVKNSAGEDFQTMNRLITVSGTPEKPAAEFRCTPQAGEGPLSVQFVDLSAGDPTSWTWDFGDGTVSSEQSPVHIYPDAGTYSVTLTVQTSAGQSVLVKQDLITVSSVVTAPVAAFRVSADEGVDPLTVRFTDLSSGDPTSWYWNFGDGETSHDRNPTHTYHGARAYTVSMQARNDGGSSVAMKEDLVTVYKADDGGDVQPTLTPTPTAGQPAGPLQARFSVDRTSGQDPLTVRFTDLSTGSPTAWYWNFGDGETSHDQNPTHTYHGARAYTVSMQARTDDDRSVTTQEDVVTVTRVGDQPIPTTTPTPAPTSTTGQPTGPLQAGFSVDCSSGQDPLTVRFTDLSTGHPTAWYWNFGDGETSHDQNPTHTYHGARAYTVSMQARTDDDRSVTTQEDVVTVTRVGDQPIPATTPTPAPTSIASQPAGKVQAQFRAAPPYGQDPLTVQFTDLSTGHPTAWYWNFGDGETSREQNPVHTYHGARAYTVSMRARNSDSESIVTMEDIVMVGVPEGWPLARCTAAPVSGTGPFSVQFTDVSTGNPTSWYWSFGDGGESTLQNPVHIYTRPGTYSVGFRVKNSRGSTVQELWSAITVR
ncbi:PKD domain-containing protein [Methanosphaerula subterraneus]|uniref:right-handed parallel beta-helix repeat-containing protein n=1 Tax=Methanosphaerula subterraneus TaxID=3350244 RepID=UPI003F86AEE6